MRAAEYSRANGYHSPEGAAAGRRPRRGRRRFALTPPARAPAGQPDYQAIVRDALNGRMLSRAAVYDLALRYERIIADVKMEMKKIAPRGRLPGSSASHKRKEPSGAAEPTGDAEAAPRARPRGRAAGPQQTEEQRQSAVIRARKRLAAKANRAMEQCSATIGGAARLTPYIVSLFRRAAKKTGTWTKNCFLQRDAIPQLLDDPDVFTVIRKEIDKRRKPEICRFMVAHLTGVTFSAMDKMRFATPWCPGHSTLSREIKRLEKCTSRPRGALPAL